MVRAIPAIRRVCVHRISGQENQVDFQQDRSGTTDSSQSQARPLVIKPRPASRQAGEPPKPIAIERTSSYLIRKKGQYETREWNPVSEDGDSVTVSRQASIPGDDNETPVSWMLRKTDESLDIVEDKVPDVARRAITFMTGNIGTNTSKVAVDAAKLAVKGGSKLVEAALPAGKWAISKGFGAVVSVAMTQQGRRKEKPRQKDDSV